MHHSSVSAFCAASQDGSSKRQLRPHCPAGSALALGCLLASVSAGVSAEIVFQAKPAVIEGNSISSIAVGDFNGDGKLDLAATDDYANYVNVYLGDGHGNLTFANAYPSQGTDQAHILAVDVNGDGKLDLVVASAGHPDPNGIFVPYGNNISILLGNGDGSFQAAVATSMGNLSPVSLAAGGFNINFYVDLQIAAKDFTCTNEPCGSVVSRRNNGDGTFYTGWTSPAILTPTSIATGLFNSGGIDDTVVSDAGGFGGPEVGVFLGDTQSTYAGPTYFNAGPGAIAVADFNNDGKRDLAVMVPASSGVSLLLGTGTGTFPTNSFFGAGGSPVAAAVADFDGDGRLDLAVARTNNSVGVLRGNATGGFDTALGFTASLQSPTCIAIGDFDGDGRADFVVGDVGAAGGRVTVFLNDLVFANGFE